MSDQPEELLDPDAPPGTPVADQVAEMAEPVWCSHGVKWEATSEGWVAEDACRSRFHGHDNSAVESGAIPCQPTYASHLAWKVLTVARREYPISGSNRGSPE